MNTFLSFTAVVIFYLIGFCVITLLPLKKLSLDFKIGLSYGLGIGIITVQMLLYSLMHIPWTPLFLLIPWLIFIILIRKHLRFSFKKIKKLSRIEFLLATLLGLVVIFVLFEALLRPVISWDGWANWFLAGKAFYIDGSFNRSYISYANNSSPPVMYMMLTFVYKIIGQVDDRVGLLPFTFFYISLLLVFFATLRKHVTIFYAILFTFFLATLQDFIRHAGLYDVGDADIAVSYFFFSTVVLFLHWRKNINIATSIIFFLFASLAALIKEEGLPFLLITLFIAAVSIYKTKKFRYYSFMLIPLCIAGTWYALVHILKLPSSPFVTKNLQIIRIPIVARGFISEFLNFKRWNLLWVTLVFSLFYYKKTESLYVLLFFFLQLSVYFGIYLMTPLNPVTHIENSFDRLLIQISPLALLFISMTFAERTNMLKTK